MGVLHVLIAKSYSIIYLLQKKLKIMLVSIPASLSHRPSGYGISSNFRMTLGHPEAGNQEYHLGPQRYVKYWPTTFEKKQAKMLCCTLLGSRLSHFPMAVQ